MVVTFVEKYTEEVFHKADPVTFFLFNFGSIQKGTGNLGIHLYIQVNQA